jgi:2-oxoisovalerate dehydrogenase E2 component (dihydrolipoyl transacylase)
MHSFINRCLVKSATTQHRRSVFRSVISHHHQQQYQQYATRVLPFNLADIGEGIKEVEVVSWSIKVGDKINEFDLVAEVKSDKANVEITSRYSGTVQKLYYNAGDIAQVGDPLIDIEVDAEADAGDVPEIKHGERPLATHETTNTTSTTSTSTTASDLARATEESIERVLTTPAVRRIARENNIDLRQVRATGPKGRVLKEDVLNYLSSPAKYSTISAAVTTAAAATTTTTATAAAKSVVLEPDRVEPVRGIKRVMIKTMNAANQIPHFGLSDDIRVDRLVQLRNELKSVADQHEVRLTFMPFFIKAASLALKQYPILNSTLSADETQITYRSAHNIGVAMDTPDGLLVPIIKNVQNMTILEIAKELKRLMDIGAKGKLGAADLSGGTFSLSNIGTIGGTYASPLLPPGNVGIGAIGKIQKVPVYDEQDRVVPAQIMNISWSADHRVIDGATMARFNKAWKQYLENPSLMLLELQ